MALLNPENWVTEYADYLYQFALSRVNEEEIAQDLVQDTFLSALKGKDKFKGNSAEKTWLCSILKNKIFDHFRCNYKQTLALEEGNSSTENRTDEFSASYFDEEYKGWKTSTCPKEWDHPFPTDIEKKEFYFTLQKCLSFLPKTWASVFCLKNMDELSGEDICKELQITSSNLYIIMHRAKLQLRSCMEKTWFRLK